MSKQQTYPEALRTLNRAVYDTIGACRDTTEWPDVDRQFLRELATKTDRMVDDIAGKGL
ncbi:hypothetical protein [Roseibium alexandrii]|uniref:hypothetical protein n=1 Tax=Roseibium alexandrii TaxID=388408 RepID=UPI003751C296